MGIFPYFHLFPKTCTHGAGGDDLLAHPAAEPGAPALSAPVLGPGMHAVQAPLQANSRFARMISGPHALVLSLTLFWRASLLRRLPFALAPGSLQGHEPRGRVYRRRARGQLSI
jgi:hypothetical protein